MAHYTQEEQTEIVRDAMILTATIEYLEDELAKVKRTVFKEMPVAPVRQIAPSPKNYQPILPEKPRVSFTIKEYFKNTKNVIIPLLGILSFVLFLCMQFLDYLDKFNLSLLVSVLLSIALFFLLFFCIKFLINFCNERKRLEEEAANSYEYQESVQAAIREAKEKEKTEQETVERLQNEYDRKYENEKHEYDTVIVPNYNHELEVWADKKKKEIVFLEQEISYNKDALENLYSETRIISVSYRELWILEWLYADMDSADHTIEYATELLDRDRQRVATERVGTDVRDLQISLHNDLGFIYNAIQDSNDSIMDLHDELHKMRRENNLGHIAGVYQRWGIKKKMNEMNDKL